jgi:tetratricopeptide (TPR) repeat protein
MKRILLIVLSLTLMQCANETTMHSPLIKNIDYKALVVCLNNLIVSDSLNYQYYKYKGICYNEIGMPDSAISNLLYSNKLINRIDKVDAEIYYQIGVSFDLKKSNDCARGMYYFAYVNDSTNTKYSNALAAQNYYMGDYDKAMTYANKTLALDSSDAQSYFMKGSIYYNQKFYSKALSEYNRGLRYEANDAMAYFDKGLIFYDIDNYTEAYRSFSFAIYLKPNIAVFYLQRAYTLLAMGYPKLALNDCKKVIELDSTISEVYHLKAIIYTNYYDKNIGCQLYQKYKNLNENYHLDTLFNYCACKNG